jgi:hypothetical protein
MRGISSLAAKPVSFSRRTVLYGVSQMKRFYVERERGGLKEALRVIVWRANIIAWDTK